MTLESLIPYGIFVTLATVRLAQFVLLMKVATTTQGVIHQTRQRVFMLIHAVEQNGPTAIEEKPEDVDWIKEGF